MYRCTECYTEYEVRPQYCDCGNDKFEEIYTEEEYEEEVEVVKKTKKPKLSAEELAELEEERTEKIKSLIVFVIALILCIFVFIMPPHKKQKMDIVKEKVAAKNVKLPSVKTFWDDTLPSAFRKDDPLASLPLLNSKINTLSAPMREYLISIGREFNKKWNNTMLDGVGECKVQFVINKEGTLSTKNIIYSSGNKKLDDSVSLLLTNTQGFNSPPDDYKGEKIYILFSIDADGHTKVSYPSK